MSSYQKFKLLESLYVILNLNKIIIVNFLAYFNLIILKIISYLLIYKFWKIC